MKCVGTLGLWALWGQCFYVQFRKCLGPNTLKGTPFVEMCTSHVYLGKSNILYNLWWLLVAIMPSCPQYTLASGKQEVVHFDHHYSHLLTTSVILLTMLLSGHYFERLQVAPSVVSALAPYCHSSHLCAI